MMKAFLSAVVLVSLLGCAHGSPPSAFERTIYDIRTQVVAVVTLQTNYVVPVGTTNPVPISVLPVTNYVENYERIPKESVITGIQTGGQIATTFGFGLGGVVASLVLGAYGAWATWRNNRKAKLNTVFAQNIETAREIIKSQAGGSALDEEFKLQIKSQQVKAGVKDAAGAVVDSTVHPAEARASAESAIKMSRLHPTESQK